MIFGTNALFTKPAQSLAPMMVVHVLSWYGYKVTHTWSVYVSCSPAYFVPRVLRLFGQRLVARRPTAGQRTWRLSGTRLAVVIFGWTDDRCCPCAKLFTWKLVLFAYEWKLIFVIKTMQDRSLAFITRFIVYWIWTLATLPVVQAVSYNVLNFEMEDWGSVAWDYVGLCIAVLFP